MKKAINRYVLRYKSDISFRISISLLGSIVFNTAYGCFQMISGVLYGSLWFISIAGYYISLALMRFFLFKYTRKHAPAEDILTEYRKYRTCGIFFLVMNLALTVMIFLMVFENKTFIRSTIPAITMATYTFAALTKSIVNVLRYRKYNSPAYSATRIICLASAAVSMLTLQSTMLNTFDKGAVSATAQMLMLGLSGAAVSIFIIVLAIFMIKRSNKQIVLLKINGDNYNENER